jgi:hypothetical protein
LLAKYTYYKQSENHGVRVAKVATLKAEEATEVSKAFESCVELEVKTLINQNKGGLNVRVVLDPSLVLHNYDIKRVLVLKKDTFHDAKCVNKNRF